MVNRTYNFWCTLALLLSGSAAAMAQTQKMGYVNTDVILSKMPAYQQAEQQLQLLSEQWRNELQQMKEEIEQLKKDYKAKKILYTDAVQHKKEQQIAQKTEARHRYRTQKFGADGAYFKKQQELLKPIQRKVFEAIKAVSERENIDFVFDRAQNTSLLYAESQWNLNEEVLQELGFTLND